MKIYPAPNCLMPTVRCTWGNFNQSGAPASFGSSENFVIAFMGSGQTAHIDDITYSRFANIDPAHCSVEMKDKPLVFVKNMGISIGKGVVSGLQEALGDLELSVSAAAVSSVIGISLSAIEAPVVVAAVAILTLIAAVIGTIQSLFMIAQSVGGIYSTATGTGTIYDKAEAFAHDFIIMVVGIVTLTGSVKSIEASLSSFKSAAQELFGRKSRLTPSEVTKTYKGAKLITSFDDFAEYAKGFLDDDALQYVKGALGNDAEDTARLKKVARLIEDGSGKIGRKLSKEEIKAGLDALWDDAGVEGALAAVERISQVGKKRYTVDPSMQAKDIEEKVLIDGVYKENPTAQNICDLIKSGSRYVGSKNMNGQFMYVVDLDGNIIIGTRSKLHMPHPTLIGGRDPVVLGAGIVDIRGGKIYSINNESGHFKPDKISLSTVQYAFEKLPSAVFHRDFQGYLEFID